MNVFFTGGVNNKIFMYQEDGHRKRGNHTMNNFGS